MSHLYPAAQARILESICEYSYIRCSSHLLISAPWKACSGIEGPARETLGSQEDTMATSSDHPESYTAYAFTEVGGQLHKVTVPWQDPGPGEIIVKVLACGVCGRYVCKASYPTTILT